eukprot:1062621-Rhodomonas_salina.1
MSAGTERLYGALVPAPTTSGTAPGTSHTRPPTPKPHVPPRIMPFPRSIRDVLDLWTSTTPVQPSTIPASLGRGEEGGHVLGALHRLRQRRGRAGTTRYCLRVAHTHRDAQRPTLIPLPVAICSVS